MLNTNRQGEQLLEEQLGISRQGDQLLLDTPEQNQRLKAHPDAAFALRI